MIDFLRYFFPCLLNGGILFIPPVHANLIFPVRHSTYSVNMINYHLFNNEFLILEITLYEN